MYSLRLQQLNSVKNKILTYKRLLLGRIRLMMICLFKPRLQIDKEGFYCGKHCFISRKNKIIIGKNFYMGNYTHLSANATIGNDVLFASFVSLVGGDHIIDNTNSLIRLSGRNKFKTITIEDNVWIGHGAIIMHGITIKTGAVVAAGAVVTKDVGINEIVGGNPAQLIRHRKFI